MSEWISVDDSVPDNEPYNEEVEIAYWDNTCMCRIFGVFENNSKTWWSGNEEIEEKGQFKVTHWKQVTPLPEPPK